jgi:hypothetical protein
MGTYERTAERLLKGQPKPRKIAKFIDGHLHTGTASLHRTPQSRRWNLFWRMKIRHEN